MYGNIVNITRIGELSWSCSSVDHNCSSVNCIYSSVNWSCSSVNWCCSSVNYSCSLVYSRYHTRLGEMWVKRNAGPCRRSMSNNCFPPISLERHVNAFVPEGAYNSPLSTDFVRYGGHNLRMKFQRSGGF